jgi:hypothetical protein
LKHRIILGSALALAVAATGCSSNGGSSKSTTPATADDYDDVAQAMSAVVATTGGGGEVGSLADSVDLSVGVMPLGVTLGANGEFAGNRVGLAYQYKLTCTDATGAKLGACNTTTDKADVNVDWSGNLTIPTFSAMVTRQGDWSLSGLQTDTVTFAGSGTFSFDAAFQSAFRPAMVQFHLDYDATYDAITMEKALHVLTGGAVHYTVKAERIVATDAKNSAANFDMDTALTFGANGAASLTLDGSHHYTVNTVSGAVVRAGDAN